MRSLRLAAALVLALAAAAFAADSVEELIAKLGSPDAAVRMDAVKTLGRRGPEADAAAPALRKVVADAKADAEVRLGAFDALRKMAVDLAPSVAPIVSLLSHDDAMVRGDAAEALGRSRTGDAAAISGLAAALADADEEVRYAAALALGEIGPKASAALEKLAARAADKDESPDVRDAAQEALRRIRRDTPPARATGPAPEPAPPAGGTRETGLAGLRASLASEDANERLRALHVIQVLGGQTKSLVDDIARQFRHSDPKVRIAALQALEAIGPDAASVIDQVAARMRDRDPAVKAAARKTLVALGARVATGVPGGGTPPSPDPAESSFAPSEVALRWKFLLAAGKAATEARDYATAEAKLRAALGHAEGFGRSDLRLAETQRALGIVLDVNQEYEEALSLFESALAIRTEVGETDDVDTAWLHHSIGGMHRRLGDYEHAELSVRRALDILRRRDPPPLRARIRFQELLSSIYVDAGRWKEAEELLRESLRDIRGEYGDADATAGRLYNTLGILYRKHEDYEKAELHFRQARDSWAESMGSTHYWVGLADQNLGLVFTDRGQPALAARVYQRAVGIFQKAFGWNHPTTLSGVEDLASSLRAAGREDEAAGWEARAERIRRALGK